MAAGKKNRAGFCIFFLILLAGCATPKACFEERCFNVEIADTPQERATGLMHRESLDPDSGMLFVFEQPGIYSFWMKDTLIPLDMIWIDANDDVVFIAENVQPCKTSSCDSIRPGKAALYVLEVNAGTVSKIGLEAGDKVEIS